MTFGIRAYRTEDCDATRQLFYDSVHHLCGADYTPEELMAWAPRVPDATAWKRSFEGRHACVATAHGVIIGFGDITPKGYLDRLYIHKDYQRRGWAAKLCDTLEAHAAGTVCVHASITARGFFERRGYRVVRCQQVIRHGVRLTNFVMEKVR